VSPGPACVRSAGCCERSGSRLRALGAVGQGGHPKSAAATLAIAEWPLARRADREIFGCALSHTHPVRPALPGALSFPGWPARAERAAGPDAGSDPASLPTGPSPHDRDTHVHMEEPGQRRELVNSDANPRRNAPCAGESARNRGTGSLPRRFCTGARPVRGCRGPNAVRRMREVGLRRASRGARNRHKKTAAAPRDTTEQPRRSRRGQRRMKSLWLVRWPPIVPATK